MWEMAMSNVDMRKLQKLLSLDLPQVAVAQALGITEGAISQFMDSPEFRAEVAAMKYARIEGAAVRDEKLDAIEDTVIDKLQKSISYMIKPSELLCALKILSGVPRKSAVNLTGAAQALGQTVNITLPNVTAITYVKTQQGEIIEAGGRSLATLPSSVLKQLAGTNQPAQQQLAVGGNNGQNRQDPRNRAITQVAYSVADTAATA
jgi:predicted transcriptional regulator